MSAALLTTTDIAALAGVSRYTVTARWSKQPGFPKPRVNVNPWARKWAAHEVQAWLEGKSGRRNAETM